MHTDTDKAYVSESVIAALHKSAYSALFKEVGDGKTAKNINCAGEEGISPWCAHDRSESVNC
jgi:hypothetical protein